MDNSETEKDILNGDMARERYESGQDESFIIDENQMDCDCHLFDFICDYCLYG